jgi:protoporphyrinogen oxidase
MSPVEADVVVIGGGIAGLTVGAMLGSRAVVLEAAARPGGLVRTDNVHGWWFDRVLHLMHFADPPTEALVRSLPMGETLAACPPEAYVQTPAGLVRYPFQLHLAGLEAPVRDRCLRDFVAATRIAGPPPANYREQLLSTFGRGMCEAFYLPYNRKMWRRPLEDLATSGFQWNLTRPDVDQVVAGAGGADGAAQAYNRNGWYPRPPAGAPYRGMELMSRGLAERVADLRPRHQVTAIDPAARVVSCAGRLFRYRVACVSTAPLPATVAMCTGAPAGLRSACDALPRNRVRSVALCVVGPRPAGFGLWRYYVDESLPFTRLVLMTGFDPLLAPSHGWGLLAEVTERAEDRPRPTADLTAEVVRGVRRLGLLDGSTVVDSRVFDNDPAYVVFTPSSIETTVRACAYLRSCGILPLGRYGRWEYSSMAQVIGDAIELARTLSPRSAHCGGRTDQEVAG